MKMFSWLFILLFLISMFSVPSAGAVVSAKQSLKNQYEDKWSGKLTPRLIAADASDQQDLYVRAEELYRQKKYDEVIQLLAGPAYADPANYKLNVLLAKAQLEKCAILKANGDISYKTLVMEPYRTGRRLHEIDKTRPEPYYIVGKSLLINNRLDRSIRTIKKALYFSPNNPEYLLVLGEGYSVLGEHAQRPRDAQRYFSQAKRAYEKALEFGKDVPELKAKAEQRLEELSKKIEGDKQDFGR